jgi:3-phenylpropionate/trans-cinnamate dioxygenase ferredoxin subunit
MARHIIARTSEIPPGGNKVANVDGRDIVVFHVNGEFFALLNRCPHEGAPLEKAACVARLTSPEPGVYQRSRVDELLRCPWHGWEFDMRNGQSWFDPKRVKVRSYPVAIESGQELAEGLAKGPLCGRDLPGAYRGQLRHRRNVSGDSVFERSSDRVASRKRVKTKNGEPGSDLPEPGSNGSPIVMCVL